MTAVVTADLQHAPRGMPPLWWVPPIEPDETHQWIGVDPADGCRYVWMWQHEHGRSYRLVAKRPAETTEELA